MLRGTSPLIFRHTFTRSAEINQLAFNKLKKLSGHMLKMQLMNKTEIINGLIRTFSAVNRVSAKRTLRFEQIRILAILNDFYV